MEDRKNPKPPVCTNIPSSAGEQGRRFPAPHNPTRPGLDKSLFASNWAAQANVASLLSSILPPHPRALRPQSKLLLLPSRQCPRRAHPAEHLAHVLRMEIFWRGTELGEGKGNMEQSVTPICRCFASQLLAFRVFPSILPLYCWA